MTNSLSKTFEHVGTYTHAGPVEAGTTIVIKGGDCVIEGPVGDNVSLQVEGNVTLKDNAGENLRVMANGSFTGQSIGKNSDVTALGEINVAYLDHGACLRSPMRTGVACEETKCGEYQLAVGNGLIEMTRKWPSQVDDPNSCRNMEFRSPATPQ